VKQAVATVLIFICLGLVGAPALAEESREIRVSGWITDQWCAKDRADDDEKADHGGACSGKKADPVLFAEGRIYELTDPAAARAFVGRKVRVVGEMADGKTLTVKSIETDDDEDA
jgi:hypothetical protein